MIIPKTMKAAVLFGPGNLRVTEREVPEPARQEVLIKVKACAICGSDPLIVKQGWHGCPPYGEFIPGHEYTGEIVAVGTGVFGFNVGDRVAAEPHKGCGVCINCIRGLYTSCLNYGNNERGHRHYGFTVNGGYAQYAVSHINCIHKIPEAVGFNEGTLLTIGGAALYGIQRIGWIWPGEKVVVIGPGPLGLMAMQLSRICGSEMVILLGTRDSRLEIGDKLGADLTLNIKK